MQISRRTLLSGLAVLAIAGTLEGCTTGTTSQLNGSGGTATRSNTIIYGRSDGGTSFVRNYNVYGPASQKAPSSTLIFEPLGRVDYSDGGAVKPWLAKAFTFDADGTRLTIPLRDDVTFSDGKKMTADDVVFSLSIPLKDPTFNLAGVSYTAVTKIDDATVRVDFDKPAFSQLGQFGNLSLPIVPQHLWQNQNLSTWTNTKPVGTGPYTLEAFVSQQVTMKARTDYWGGTPPVAYFKVVPTTADTTKAKLLNGEIDWGMVSWPGATSEYIDKDPKTNLYQLYSGGGAYSVLFNTGKAPFDNVHLRRALALSIPRSDITATLNRPGTEAGPTGLVDQVYKDWIDPQYLGTVQQVDAAGAQAELKASGFSVQGGALVSNGKKYTPSLSFNNDFGWGPYADIMINSWKKVLGLEVKHDGLAGSALDDQQKTGGFDMTIVTTGAAGIYGVYSILSSAYYVPEGQNAVTNLGRWKDPQTDQVLAQMAQTADSDQLKKLGWQMQKIVVDQVPFSPLYVSYWFVDINASHWTGWPTPDDFTSVPYPDLGPDAILTLLALKPAAA